MISVAANRIHSPCHANHIQGKQKGGGIKKRKQKRKKKKKKASNLWDGTPSFVICFPCSTIP